MVSHIVTLIAGVVLGAMLMIAFHQPRAGSVEVSNQNTGITANKSPRDELPKTNESVSSGDTAHESENKFSDNNEIQEFIPARTPAIYEDIIGPVVPTYSDAELHATFKKEPRKEPWASAMEEGINQVADFSAGNGMVIEYVECRSRTCEIAGYVIHGGENKASELWMNIVRSGWWQGGTSLHISTGGGDDFNGFVMIVYDKGR